MFLKCLVFSYILFFSNSIVSSQLLISGKVVDKEQIFINNVEISVKGSKKRTFTNNKGEFWISAYLKDTLIFSHISYKQCKIAFNEQKQINITLELKVYELPEVLISGTSIMKQRYLNKIEQEILVYDKQGYINSKVYINNVTNKVFPKQINKNLSFSRPEIAFIKVDDVLIKCPKQLEILYNIPDKSIKRMSIIKEQGSSWYESTNKGLEIRTKRRIFYRLNKKRLRKERKYIRSYLKTLKSKI